MKIPIHNYSENENLFNCLVSALEVISDEVNVCESYIDSVNHTFVVEIKSFKTTLANNIKIAFESMPMLDEYFDIGSIHILSNCVIIPINYWN